MTRLNLGCGRSYIDGFVNIDREPKVRADLHIDLEGEAWPFEDGTVTEIVARYILEHIDDLGWVMSECYRVMEPGALLRITTVHPASNRFWDDPTHKRPITAGTLALFSRAKCAEYAGKGWPYTPLAEYLDVDFEVIETNTDLEVEWFGKNLSKIPSFVEFATRRYINVIEAVHFIVRRV